MGCQVIAVLERTTSEISYETQKIFEVNMYFPKEIVKNWDTDKTT